MRILVFILLLVPFAAVAGDRDFRLSAPQALVESGLLKYLLPRFSLKTSIRIEVVAAAEDADAVLASDGYGTAVFSEQGTLWWLEVINGHAGAQRFADWLTTEVGQRTVTSYTVDGQSPFSLPEAGVQVDVVASFDGDAVEGRKVAHLHCGRCHVVSDDNRMNAIGSTPSFFVLKAMRDWEERFEAFFTLNPHPAFTQVKDVTEPFPINRPSPIFPVEISLDDIDAILAYVNQLTPADLGAPIQHQ